ncbi:sugar ABC transporter substrate-binding protein [Ramlibacter sp.]|uniref:sugar ABC transporter substrate-binding protein n=1 Tax=Ramlibacter sp. TaxID=1917967 RepID=UPI003D0DEB09
MSTRTFLKAIAVTLLAGSALLAQQPAFAQAPAPKRVALLVGPTQDKYIGAWSKAFTEAAAPKGITTTVFSSPFDPALQAQQVDDALAQKFDMLVVQTISQKAIVPALTRAKAAKVPVVLIISEFPGNESADLYQSYIGTNSGRLGELAGEAIGKAMTASGRPNARIAAITGSMAEGIAPMRMDGMKRALARYPGIQIVAVEDVKWNPAQAERTAGQVLARFGAQGGLDGIYGMNDSLANGAIQAALAAGVKLGAEKGALTVVGGNCQAPGVKNLQEGRMAASVRMIPAEEARLAAARIRDFFDGKTLEKRHYIEHEIITQANLVKTAADCSY